MREKVNGKLLAKGFVKIPVRQAGEMYGNLNEDQTEYKGYSIRIQNKGSESQPRIRRHDEDSEL